MCGGKSLVHLWAAAVLATGCHVGGEGDYAFDGALESAGETSTQDDDVDGDGSRAPGGDAGEEPKEEDDDDDDSEDPDAPELPVEPCVGLDLVFVVNNTHTMMDEQLRLQAAAAAFVDQLAMQIPEVMANSHIGVLTTDDHRFVATSSACTAPYASGASYMVFGETMTDELGCSLEVGIGGDPDERPAQMLLGALADDMRSPGAFHEGFVRDKALLVVVVATDEDDRPDPVTGWGSQGEPNDWAAALAAVKGGHEQDVVVLSLVGTPKPNACPDYQWNGHDGAEVADRLIDFTQAFRHGSVGDVCAPEYASFLLGRIPSIADACNEFVAP